MPNAYQVDPFSRLPLSALIAIAKDMPDLASLHSFRFISPACATVFMEPKRGAHIVELFLNADNRIYASNLGISQDGSHAAHRCLHTLLERFTALRPWRPENAKCNLKRLPFWKYSPNTPFRLPPEREGQLVGINLKAAAGPLEWFEEQNVVYGAWLLALYAIVRETPEPYIWPPPRSIAQASKSLAIRRKHEGNGNATSAPGQVVNANHTHTTSAIIYFLPMGIVSRARHFWSNALDTPWSAIRAAPIGPFRALGFSIWGEYRFIHMGLLTSSHDLAKDFANAADVAECSDWYAWKSVLTLPQLEALKDAQYDAWVQWQQDPGNRKV